MAITIKHTYNTQVKIFYFLNNENDDALQEIISGDMDDITDHICKFLVEHNFSAADVRDIETGEILMIVTRT